MSAGDRTNVAGRAYVYADGQDHRDYADVRTRVVAGWIGGYRAAELDQAAADVLQPGTEPHRTNDERVTTEEVYAWHVGRFGVPDVLMVSGKLAEETGETCGAIVKRAEGAVRPAKGLVTREDWTSHLLDEIGDVGIVLHVLAAREGTTLDELVTRRFRGDVSKRVDQERAPRGYEKPEGCRCPGPVCRNDRAYGTEL